MYFCCQRHGADAHQRVRVDTLLQAGVTHDVSVSESVLWLWVCGISCCTNIVKGGHSYQLPEQVRLARWSRLAGQTNQQKLMQWTSSGLKVQWLMSLVLVPINETRNLLPKYLTTSCWWLDFVLWVKLHQTEKNRLNVCLSVCLSGVRTVFNYHPADLLYTVDLRVPISSSSFYIHCCMMVIHTHTQRHTSSTTQSWYLSCN